MGESIADEGCSLSRFSIITPIHNLGLHLHVIHHNGACLWRHYPVGDGGLRGILKIGGAGYFPVDLILPREFRGSSSLIPLYEYEVPNGFCLHIRGLLPHANLLLCDVGFVHSAIGGQLIERASSYRRGLVFHLQLICSRRGDYDVIEFGAIGVKGLVVPPELHRLLADKIVGWDGVLGETVLEICGEYARGISPYSVVIQAYLQF